MIHCTASACTRQQHAGSLFLAAETGSNSAEWCTARSHQMLCSHSASPLHAKLSVSGIAITVVAELGCCLMHILHQTKSHVGYKAKLQCVAFFEHAAHCAEPFVQHKKLSAQKCNRASAPAMCENLLHCRVCYTKQHSAACPMHMTQSCVAHTTHQHTASVWQP